MKHRAKLISAERVEGLVMLTFEYDKSGIVVQVLVSDADCFNSMIDRESYLRVEPNP